MFDGGRFCGSYSAIAGGFEAWGLKVLTGNNVFTFRCLNERFIDLIDLIDFII